MGSNALTWLLASDGSANAERAARFAAAFARLQRVRQVHLVNVQQPQASGLATGRIAVAGPEARAAGEQSLAAARRRLEVARLRVHAHVVVSGDPAAALAATARRLRVDEVILGTRGTSALGNLVLGSVAYKVLSLVAQPLTLVPPGQRPHRMRRPSAGSALRLVLATDGSKSSLRAVAYVCRLHEAGTPLQVYLLNAQPRIVSGTARRVVSQAAINAYFRERGEEALQPARRLLDRAGVRYRDFVRAGSYPETIVDLAEEFACSRIVMGTRAMGRFKSLVLDSTVYGVVSQAEAAVTVIR